jgi:hypothetical protein
VHFLFPVLTLQKIFQKSVGIVLDHDDSCGYSYLVGRQNNTRKAKMQRTFIVTSKFYKTIFSVVRGTTEQVKSLLDLDPSAYGYKAYAPSDWMYKGEVIDLSQTSPQQAAKDIIRGVASLPTESRWMAP